MTTQPAHCPVCHEPIAPSCTRSMASPVFYAGEIAIVTSYEVRGHTRSLDGAPDDTETPTSISFTCKCGASVEVTDMDQDEDHLSLFGRAMSYTPACPERGIYERFMHRGSRTIIWRENGKWFHNHELQFPDMTAEFATKTDLTGHATKFDARDACERAIRDLSNRLQTLIEGGIFGL